MTHNICENRRTAASSRGRNGDPLTRLLLLLGLTCRRSPALSDTLPARGYLAALGAGTGLEMPQVVGSAAAQRCSQPLAERAERQTRSCTPERAELGGCSRCSWRSRCRRRIRRVKGLPCRGGRGKVVIRGAQPALRLQRQRRGGTCT
jgi:hypothetical protein